MPNGLVFTITKGAKQFMVLHKTHKSKKQKRKLYKHRIRKSNKNPCQEGGKEPNKHRYREVYATN